jgi:hypothetical protein
MNVIRKVSTLLFAASLAAYPVLPAFSAPVTTVSFVGGLDIEIAGFGAPTPNTLVSGNGTFSDPWLLSSAGNVSAEVQFSNTSVTDCSTIMNYNSDFVIDPFTSGQTACSFTISVPGQAFGVKVSISGGQTTVYVKQQGAVTPPQGGQIPASSPTPVKYSGPEFSGLSGMGIMTGSTGKLEGKRLNEISSIEIGGKAATFTATSATELSLSLPAGLAPGLYDLVINSPAGKLTHINAIQVRAPKQSFSIMTRSKGKISEQQYLEHSLIASMQIPELNKARCVVNASSMAMARAMADRLCAIVKASNPNIETTVVEPRSSVKGDAVFARVSYGWN